MKKFIYSKTAGLQLMILLKNLLHKKAKKLLHKYFSRSLTVSVDQRTTLAVCSIVFFRFLKNWCLCQVSALFLNFFSLRQTKVLKFLWFLACNFEQCTIFINKYVIFYSFQYNSYLFLFYLFPICFTTPLINADEVLCKNIQKI